MSDATRDANDEFCARWAEGAPCAVEDFLDDSPTVPRDAATVAALAYTEYRLRMRNSSRPATSTYLRRFMPLQSPESGPVASTGSPPEPTAHDLLQEMFKQEKEKQGPTVGEQTAPDLLEEMSPRSDEPVTPAADDWPSLPDYDLLFVLDTGGMGTVYHTYDIPRRRMVAVKVMLPEQLSANSGRARFALEAVLTARLDHPHIVKLFATQLDGKLPYLVMQLVRGGGLHRRLGEFVATAPSGERPLTRKETRRRSAEIVSRLMVVTEAVDHAHKRGVLHLDLKTDNLLVAANGDWLVSDFGLSRMVETSDGVVSASSRGHPNYMAPELLEKRCGSVFADVYSLGAILYELLAGQMPPRAGAGTLTGPRAVNDRIDRDLDAVCQKCLARVPEQRYQTAAALADDLQHFLAGEPVSARRPFPPRRLGMWVLRNRAATAAIVLLTALTVTLGGATWAISAQSKRERQLRVAATKTLADVVNHTVKSDDGPTDRRDLLGSVDELVQLLKRYDPRDSTTARLELSAVAARGFVALELRRFHEASAEFQSLLDRLAELGDSDRRRFQVTGESGLAMVAIKSGKLDKVGPILDRLLASLQVEVAVDDAELARDAVFTYELAGFLVRGAVVAYSAAGRDGEAIRVARAFVDLPDGPARVDFTAASRRAEVLGTLGALRFLAGDREGGCADLEATEGLARAWHAKLPEDKAAVTLRWRCAVLAGHFVGQVNQVKGDSYLALAEAIKPQADLRSWPHLQLIAAAIRPGEEAKFGRTEDLTQLVHRVEALALDSPTPEIVGTLEMGYAMMAITAYLDGDNLSAAYWRNKVRTLRAKPPGGVRPQGVGWADDVEKAADETRSRAAEYHASLVKALFTSLPLAKENAALAGTLASRASWLGDLLRQHPKLSAIRRRTTIDLALALLEAAEVLGIPNAATLEKEESFDDLRQEPRFKSLVDRLKQKAAGGKGGK